MASFSISAEAKSDILDIGRYTRKRWGIRQRDQYLKAIYDAFQRLADDRLMGGDYSILRKGYLKYKVESHWVYYQRIKNSEIYIVRVLHQRMDVALHLMG